MIEEKQLVIIGSGFSGLLLAIKLKSKLNFHDFVVYDYGKEKVSGTWHQNCYPGAGCDVPSHLYCYSFEPNPDWSSFWVGYKEIHEYQRKVSEKYGLEKHISTQVEAVSAKWLTDKQQWLVSLKDLKTNRDFKILTKALVTATGILSHPNSFPVQAGLQDFKGSIFHTARFDHSVQLEGKRIVVIGNGCSATQMVPHLVKVAKSVVQVVRSPHYIEPLPLPNVKFGSWFTWLLEVVPFLNLFLRLFIFFATDLDFALYKESWMGRLLRRTHEKISKAHIKRNAPAKYVDLLLPTFQYGMKRRVFDTDYLSCLHKPNMLLTNDPVVKLSKTGIVCKSGQSFQADVIINATGFLTGKSQIPFPITGDDGVTLKERWKGNGPAAYMAGYIASAPNFVMLLGTNTYQGHTSVIFTAECHVNHVIQYLGKLLQNPLVKSIKVKQSAEEEFTKFIDDKFKSLIFRQNSVAGWYHKDLSKRNSVIWPGFQSEFWWKSLYLNWKDFTVISKQP